MKLQSDNRLSRKIFPQGYEIGNMAFGNSEFLATKGDQTKTGEPCAWMMIEVFKLLIGG